MMKWRSALVVGLVVLEFLSRLLFASGAAFPASSPQGLASPYFFSLPRWEASHLWDLATERLWSDRGLPGDDREEIRLVKDYFSQRRVEGQEARVKAILTRQISQAMSQEGISLWPPLAFSIDTVPQVLVISPRARIELQLALLLKPDLNRDQASELEKKVEALPENISALVEGLGGLATYPSLVPPAASLELTVRTIAHEWVHQYLFFHPLGRRYRASYQMTTINETVADLVGSEIASKVLALYGRQLERGGPRGRGGADFNQEMRQSRLKVDELLAQGRVSEAETYMESRRQFLADQGFYLRRLNQAYFAFHGSYADSPASDSPVAGWLSTLRQRYSSLGEFLRRVAAISRYEELEGMARE